VAQEKLENWGETMVEMVLINNTG